MHYEGTVIRPPSEADSILLQITVGCSHNKCTFCGAYKGERFKIKDDDTIARDIEYAAKHYPNTRRLFLLSGDALIISQERLLAILKQIQEKLPWIVRVGVYGNAKGIARKSVEELKELKKHGLGIVYMGLESGDDETLKKVCKRGDSAFIVEQGKKVKAAGIKLSITVLLGLAGPDRSDIHAKATGRALSQMDPEYIGALTLMLIPGTPMFEDWEIGDFTLLEPEDMLRELRTMIAHTNLSRGLFMANHASNYLPIRARMPRDKENALRMIDDALSGKVSLKPDWLRGL